MLKLQEIKWILWKTVSIVPILTSAILLMGCSTSAGPGSPTEDTAYLTPIPKETLQAYQWDTAVKNKIDAVILARLSLDTTRLSYTAEPKVVLAEEMRFEDVRRRVSQRGVITTFEERSGEAKVWLGLFEGGWQISGLPADP